MFENSVIPLGLEKLLAGIAAKQVALRPPKAVRVTLLSAAKASVARGELPGLLEFKSETNYSYNAHAKTLRDFAATSDIELLEEYEIRGSNTYARALRGYRDLLVEFVKKREQAQSTMKKAG